MTSLTPVMRIGAQIEEAILAHEPATAKEALDRRRNSVAQLASRIAVMRPANSWSRVRPNASCVSLVRRTHANSWPRLLRYPGLPSCDIFLTGLA